MRGPIRSGLSPRDSFCGAVGQGLSSREGGHGQLHLPGSPAQHWENRLRVQRGERCFCWGRHGRRVPAGDPRGSGRRFDVTSVHTLSLGIPSATKVLETSAAAPVVQGRAGVHHVLSPRLQIPVPVLQISATQHPVKAGLSDAFMILNPSPDVPGERLRLRNWGRRLLGQGSGGSRRDAKAPLGEGADGEGEVRGPHLWALQDTRRHCLDSRWAPREREEARGARLQGCPSCPTSPAASLPGCISLPPWPRPSRSLVLWVAPAHGRCVLWRGDAGKRASCFSPSVFQIAVSSQAIASLIPADEEEGKNNCKRDCRWTRGLGGAGCPVPIGTGV